MKWRNKFGKREDQSKNDYLYGFRKVKKFAILPVHIKGNTVWLERYTLVQLWGECTGKWIDVRLEEIV